MKTRHFTLTLALTALATGCVAGYRRSHARRLLARPHVQPRALQAREGEGAALPRAGGHSAASQAGHDEPLPRGLP